MYIIARDNFCSKLSSEVFCTLMLPRESEQQRSQVTYHTVGTCYGYQVCCHHILHSTAHKLSRDIHVLQNSHSHPLQLISNLRYYHQIKAKGGKVDASLTQGHLCLRLMIQTELKHTQSQLPPLVHKEVVTARHHFDNAGSLSLSAQGFVRLLTICCLLIH